MAKKKEVYKVKPLNENKKNIISALIEEYDIETADDIQEALKDLLGGTIKSMMESEMDEHLGYENYERSDNDNYRNGTKRKTVRSNYGEFQIDVPQDRQSSFEPKVVKKRQKDISGIDQQIISMYARGLTDVYKRQVMGCAVNGPGEARGADRGVACGKGKGVIFSGGEILKTVPEEKIADEIIKLAGEYDKNTGEFH